MVALNESSIFEEVIRRVETTDPVMGGEPNPATGQAPVNIGLLQAANRTRWLFDAIEEMYTNGEIDDAISAAFGVLTAAEILTRIKTVDGTGSGLDADLLDGIHASGFWKTADAAQSITNPGWQKLPSGLYLQWGNVSSQDGHLVGFPLAFPTAAFVVTFGDPNSSAQNVFATEELTRSNFRLRMRDAVTNDVISSPNLIYFFAIGV